MTVDVQEIMMDVDVIPGSGSLSFSSFSADADAAAILYLTWALTAMITIAAGSSSSCFSSSAAATTDHIRKRGRIIRPLFISEKSSLYLFLCFFMHSTSIS